MNLSYRLISCFSLKSILLVIFFSLWTITLLAQNGALTDSLQTYIQQQVQAEVKQQLEWIYKIFGFTAILLTVWAAITWFYRIKKVAETQIDKKAGEIVENKISEKVGVKTNLIRAYFQRLEAEQRLYQKRILIVNATAGKRLVLEDMLADAGFSNISGSNKEKQTVFFKTLIQLETGIDTNKYDLLLFDNYDGQLQETEMTKIVDQYGQALKFVCFTNTDWGQKNYHLYNKKIKFVKEISYLGDALRNALKEKRGRS